MVFSLLYELAGIPDTWNKICIPYTTRANNPRHPHSFFGIPHQGTNQSGNRKICMAITQGNRKRASNRTII